MSRNSTLRIISIGGAGEFSVLLPGLKRYPVESTAMVTVIDAGRRESNP
jgi:2-phospho-L-lactate transferase/gluconeogenesis factor (CofD/UPF0052 family)